MQGGVARLFWGDEGEAGAGGARMYLHAIAWAFCVSEALAAHQVHKS